MVQTLLCCTGDYLGNQVVTLSEEQLVDVGPRTSLESWRESPPEVLVVLLDISDGDGESPRIFCKYFFIPSLHKLSRVSNPTIFLIFNLDLFNNFKSVVVICSKFYRLTAN